jgi:hypothetical protein
MIANIDSWHEVVALCALLVFYGFALRLLY